MRTSNAARHWTVVFVATIGLVTIGRGSVAERSAPPAPIPPAVVVMVDLERVFNESNVRHAAEADLKAMAEALEAEAKRNPADAAAFAARARKALDEEKTRATIEIYDLIRSVPRSSAEASMADSGGSYRTIAATCRRARTRRRGTAAST